MDARATLVVTQWKALERNSICQAKSALYFFQRNPRLVPFKALDGDFVILFGFNELHDRLGRAFFLCPSGALSDRVEAILDWFG